MKLIELWRNEDVLRIFIIPFNWFGDGQFDGPIEGQSPC